MKYRSANAAWMFLVGVGLVLSAAASFAADSSTGDSSGKGHHHFHDKSAFQACLKQVGISPGADGKVDWQALSTADRMDFHQCMQAAHAKFKQEVGACLEAHGVPLPMSRPLSDENKQALKGCIASVKASVGSGTAPGTNSIQ